MNWFDRQTVGMQLFVMLFVGIFVMMLIGIPLSYWLGSNRTEECNNFCLASNSEPIYIGEYGCKCKDGSQAQQRPVHYNNTTVIH